VVLQDGLWQKLSTSPLFHHEDSADGSTALWSYVAPTPPSPPGTTHAPPAPPLLTSLSALLSALPAIEPRNRSPFQHTLDALTHFTAYLTSQMYALPAYSSAAFRLPGSLVGRLSPQEEEIRREIRALKGLVLNRCDPSFCSTVSMKLKVFCSMTGGRSCPGLQVHRLYQPPLTDSMKQHRIVTMHVRWCAVPAAISWDCLRTIPKCRQKWEEFIAIAGRDVEEGVHRKQRGPNKTTKRKPIRENLNSGGTKNENVRVLVSRNDMCVTTHILLLLDVSCVVNKMEPRVKWAGVSGIDGSDR
jgi:hypothetical protein